METIDSKNLDFRFKYDVAGQPGGENIKLCFACGTCTAGCPVSEIDPEFNPRKIIRQILLGMRSAVLSSPLIWRCAQCYSCTAKCPQDVKFRGIVKALREMAVDEGLADGSLIEKVATIDCLSQKVRRSMAAALFDDPGKFEELKEKAEELV